MTFESLIKEVAYKMSISKSLSETFLRTFMEVTTESLSNGEDVVLPGLFRLTNTLQAERSIFHKTKKEVVRVPEKRRLKIIPFSKLKDAINE